MNPAAKKQRLGYRIDEYKLFGSGYSTRGRQCIRSLSLEIRLTGDRQGALHGNVESLTHYLK